MRIARISRRRLLLAAGATLAAPPLARAPDAIDLRWDDLIPHDETAPTQTTPRAVTGIVQHGELTTGFEQACCGAVTTDYDGKRVRLPGYMVPLEYQEAGVSLLLLVPYIGACIHVPPPPPNQIVMVTAREPYALRGFFEAIVVTGIMQTLSVTTGLAEVGYVIGEAEVTPYV